MKSDRGEEIRISVVIPAYNAETFLAETLDSVYAQRYSPCEVIVVDDGSKDRTGEVVRQYSHGNAGISLTYIYQDNAGPSAARNTGIRKAKGEWIAFLDADDLWVPEKLGKQVSHLRSNGDTALIFGDMAIFDAGGTLVPSAYTKFGYPQCDGNGAVPAPFETLIAGNLIFTGTALVKKDCFERVGYFDESLWHGEDYDMWLRIALHFEMACLPVILMRRRMHGGNLSKGEEFFYTSKMRILRKLACDAVAGPRFRNLLRESYLTTMKELSYLFYLKKRYLRSVVAFANYAFCLFRLNVLGSAL